MVDRMLGADTGEFTHDKRLTVKFYATHASNILTYARILKTECVLFCALSEQLAHSAVDLRLKEISEFLHGSEMNKNPTLP